MRFEWPGIAISWPLPVPPDLPFSYFHDPTSPLYFEVSVSCANQCLGTGFKGLQADRESFFPYVFLFLNSNNI